MRPNLNHKQIQSLVKAGKTGRFSVGGGLTIRVTKEGTGFWVVRYSIHNKRREREIALGRFGTLPGDLSLVDAKAKAAQIKAGIRSSLTT